MKKPLSIEKNLAVLCGGRSGEHEVSLRSAASVLRHLKLDDSKIVLIGITLEGDWLLQGRETLKQVKAGKDLQISDGPRVVAVPGQGLCALEAGVLRNLDISLVFPVLHGTFGEDGTLQGYLDMLDLPYVGSGVLGSAVGMDKAVVKCLWRDAGLPIVPFTTLKRHEYKPGSEYLLWDEWTREFQPPLFVKPARGGSSVGISRVEDLAGLAPALEQAFRFDTKLVIEPGVNAREIEVSVTGNENPQAYLPGEIVPSHEFYDYDAKYLDPAGARLQIPAEISEEQLQLARTLAVKAYAVAEAAGLSRVDFFLDRDDGSLILNEINTMPGFTNISMFPMMCEASGLAYDYLIEELLELGIKAWETRKQLRFRK